ncbi:tetratricopeptide repeat protein [uncultured Desulfosarcina sp.]|uniref:tetratricopeptide repeat protein n=1 Tax=uncultured Desulfosarcina sp. TaxID=218289 RepID=UPI0029C6B093|nr:tetratricopeptide repeat protein [uncultured Desulfosarcina sp.]
MEKRTMKKILAVIMLLAASGICACAATPKATSTVDRSEQGDQELKRGMYWYHRGCSRKALDHFQVAYEYFSLHDQPQGVARSLIGLAHLHRLADNRENAILFYDAALTAARRCGDQTVTARALSGKAALLIDADDLSGAEALLDEAQLISTKNGSVSATLLNHRAVLEMKEGHYDEALALLDQADSNAVEADSPAAATIRFTRARVLMRTGHDQQAMALFQQALELDRGAGFSQGVAADLLAIADIYERSGQNENALDCLERSLKIYALMGNRKIVLDHLERLESLAEQVGSDTRVTVHYINQWLAGEAVDVVCR